MILTPKIAVFFTNLSTMVGQAYEAEPPGPWEQFTFTEPTDSEIHVDAWTGLLDKMRVWNGPRTFTEPAPQTYQVTVLPFQQGVTIDRFHLDDDKFGVYYRTIPDMARAAKRWPGLEIRNFLEGSYPWSGAPQNGLDGTPHWNTAHLVDAYNPSAGTYCNDFSGAGQNIGGVQIGGAFSPTAFKTMFEYMSVIKGEDGEPIGVTPTMLLHPMGLKGEVELVLKNMSFAPPAWGTITGQVGAADNVFRRYGVEPLLNPLLTSPTRFYLFDTSRPCRAVRWILRQSPIFTQRIAEDDPMVFDLHRYAYGQWGRAAPAWNLAWMTARGGT